MKSVFFLGGHDLEMVTIKKILDEYKQEYLDKDLSWSEACLSEYADSFAL